MRIEQILNEINCEGVHIHADQENGAIAIVAIHSTALGPAVGGCRMRAYGSFNEALQDVLRLAQGMSYKNALAGLSYGGGKAVLLADPSSKVGRRQLMSAFGAFVRSLNGRYYTAEDMGTNVNDIEAIRESCPYVVGTARASGGCGDPSPFTALGVLHGMVACCEHRYKKASLKGRHVLVQGVGNVGMELVKLLHQEGARVSISDVDSNRVRSATALYGCSSVPPEQIFETACDIFSPCAIGGIVTKQVATRMSCSILAGAANNQLSAPEVERILCERGILYAPDFAINAGGVIACVDQLEAGGFSLDRVTKRVEKIYQTILSIIAESSRSGAMTGETAVRIASCRIESQTELAGAARPTRVSGERSAEPQPALCDMPI